MHVLCECTFRTKYGAGPLVKNSFIGENARRCCLQWTENRSRGFDDVRSKELWSVRNEAYQRDKAERERRLGGHAKGRGHRRGKGRG